MVAVNHQQKTGIAWRIGALSKGKYQIAGMPATAPFINSQHSANKKDHGLFIAFAPANKPQIVVAVVAEHTAHGSLRAAPIAAKLIQAYMRKQNSNKKSTQLNNKTTSAKP